MRPLALRPFWLAIAWFGVGCALVFSLWPGGAPLPFHVWDKIEHATGYFLLTSWFAGLYRRERYARLGLGCLLLGILIELLQGLTPTRSMELGDALANATGISVALGAAYVGLGGWAEFVERCLGVTPRAVAP